MFIPAVLSQWAKPQVLIIGLVLIFVGLSGMRAAQIYRVETTGGATSIEKSAPAASDLSQSADITALAALNVFGKKALAAEQSVIQKPQELPKTRLKLILKGAFTSTENERASALIAESKRGKGKRYYIDDRLPGGAVLHEVFNNSITIKRAGRLETLEFPLSSQGKSIGNHNASQRRNTSVNAQRGLSRVQSAQLRRQSVQQRLKGVRELQDIAQQHGVDLSNMDQQTVDTLINQGVNPQDILNNPAIPDELRQQLQRSLHNQN